LRLRSPSASRSQAGTPGSAGSTIERAARLRHRLDLTAVLAEERPTDAQREARADRHPSEGRGTPTELVEDPGGTLAASNANETVRRSASPDASM
jgi:hypothetical protein